MSTPAVGQVIDEGNVDEFLLPNGAVLVDGSGYAWQYDGIYWHPAINDFPRPLLGLVDAFGPVEVAWLPPVDPTPHLSAVQESLERRAA